ncbi:hypothetical protein CVT26_002402 [Gymnopilus dilepis]|uniref:Uncharacterized protein n=1 Tax=Gymnopilus dilepis TaxID=231916 RepID=A0A409Y3P0_9AGAR|nr:hypothetical protein CVT26_002402 [Gymnopilus dilepis]
MPSPPQPLRGSTPRKRGSGSQPRCSQGNSTSASSLHSQAETGATTERLTQTPSRDVHVRFELADEERAASDTSATPQVQWRVALRRGRELMEGGCGKASQKPGSLS